MNQILDPKQAAFAQNYTNPDSATFGNCYQSALAAGYSVSTAKNLTSNKPKWLSDLYGQTTVMKPAQLLVKLEEIVNDREQKTQHRLKAVELMMKAQFMFTPPPQNNSKKLHITLSMKPRVNIEPPTQISPKLQSGV